MLLPIQQHPVPLNRLIQEKSRSFSFSEKIWNVVSLIFFPIGIYRVACHLIAKYQFSPFILGSSSSYVRLLNNHEQAIKALTTPYLTSISDIDITIKKQTVKTSDGLTLDGVHITHKEQSTLPREKQKYLVYVLPAKGIWQQKISELIQLSKATKRSILCVNYRATGASTLKRPSSFKDLFCDIETSLASLTGILKENTVLYAHSIGCSTALHLAHKYKMKAVIQNTFHTLEGLTELYSKTLVRKIIRDQILSVQEQQELPIEDKKTKEVKKVRLSFSKRVSYALKDSFLSLPHLIVRVSYFCLSLLDNLIRCQTEKASLDLKEIGKTVLIDLALTISGVIAIPVSLFSNRVNQFNGSLKSKYLNRPALATFAESPKFIWIAKKILDATGWSVNNTKTALAIGKENLFVVQVKHDKTIPYEFSLAKALQKVDPSFTIHTFEDHLLDQDADQHDFMASPALQARHSTDQELLRFLST
jgi:hypothetical protein